MISSTSKHERRRFHWDPLMRNIRIRSAREGTGIPVRIILCIWSPHSPYRSRRVIRAKPLIELQVTTPGTAVPTSLEYAKESAVQVIQILDSAAEWIPVPYVGAVIHVALKVVQSCEVGSFSA